MDKGEVGWVVDKVYELLRTHRGDIDRRLALIVAEDVAPRGVDPEAVVDRMENMYRTRLDERGYR